MSIDLLAKVYGDQPEACRFVLLDADVPPELSISIINDAHPDRVARSTDDPDSLGSVLDFLLFEPEHSPTTADYQDELRQLRRKVRALQESLSALRIIGHFCW